MCREPLPEGPESKYDLGVRQYARLQRLFDRQPPVATAAAAAAAAATEAAAGSDGKPPPPSLSSPPTPLSPPPPPPPALSPPPMCEEEEESVRAADEDRNADTPPPPPPAPEQASRRAEDRDGDEAASTIDSRPHGTAKQGPNGDVAFATLPPSLQPPAPASWTNLNSDHLEELRSIRNLLEEASEGGHDAAAG